MQTVGGRFTVTGPDSLMVGIGTSTNLTAWSTIGSVTLTNGSASFLDTGATNLKRRFYRAFPQ